MCSFEDERLHGPGLAYQPIDTIQTYNRMTEVIATIDSSSITGPTSQEQLVRSLDTLLERYLHLLDQCQTLQQELSKHLSAVWTLL